MGKKKNPRNIPVSLADVKKAQSFATESAWAIFFTVLRDKENMDVEQLKRIWQHIEDLSDSISKGYVKLDDLKLVLEEEADLVFIKKYS